MRLAMGARVFRRGSVWSVWFARIGVGQDAHGAQKLPQAWFSRVILVQGQAG
jgi:hypothetical protein